MKFGKYFTSVGSLGSTVPTVVLIVFAILAIGILKKAPSASTYTIAAMTPKLNMNSLVAISSIMFAYTGAQLTANFISEMDNPKKNYPKAIIFAAIIICVLYAIGSVCMTMLLPTSEIYAATGTLDAIRKACTLLGIPQGFVQLIAFGIALSVLGALVLYIAQPTKMLFGYTEPGIFSESFSRKNENGIPEKAIIFQAALISLILTMVQIFPLVDTIYNVLVTMTALTTLFPYLFLFLAYSKIKKEKEDRDDLFLMTKNKSFGVKLGYTVFALCCFAIVCSALPILGNTRDNIIYEAELIGGAVVIIVSGLIMWKRSGLENKMTPIKDIEQGKFNKD